MTFPRLLIPSLALLFLIQAHVAAAPLKVGVLVYDDLTISEITAPLEVYGMAGPNGERPFEVVLIGATKKPVKSHEGLRFFPEVTFDTCPPLDVLVVPGSMDASVGEKNPRVHAFLQKHSKKVAYVTSHCAGAFVLGNAGLLDGRRATTYLTGEKLLQQQFPKAKVQGQEINFVVDGNLVTSKGALVSYEASLWVVRQLAGDAHADYVNGRIYLSRLNKANAVHLH
ncbi:DJ-1/PfpI family protein [Sulfidibacter corallicola]|uniref:DJ-1/PfpI family protein n=1 Tax=Sulfidibacter corallicola TaxID=2818388 RepID=A0A8A4TEZ0_SULCO|nr:DJ-1/PfpI family protein [Sulfidibacter corallicola]QTD48669.1 DJ-1/PfpI family protein [Sulfidibacter corallicola]